MRTRVEKLRGVWLASCPICGWVYSSRDLPTAHDEATAHTCEVRLGPRPLPVGTHVSGIEGSTAVYVERPAVAQHRMEVWL